MRTRLSRHRTLRLSCLIAVVLVPSLARAYPLDGYDHTGITRLEHQRMVQEGELTGRKRPAGELLPLSRVDLRLDDRGGLTIPTADPKVTAALK